ncbi:hypothetical protein [Bradyrhizobium elkanii]|uniref:hypothetical protein n=1 Tax=Bradyrhizobium elkanii TaxID=29448 RepID=UPI00351335A8
MSIIEDFANLNVELSKLEQAKMPTVQPDFSNSGDVTDEARKTYYGMFGYPTGGGIEDIQTCFARFNNVTNFGAWSFLEDEAAGC